MIFLQSEGNSMLQPQTEVKPNPSDSTEAFKSGSELLRTPLESRKRSRGFHRMVQMAFSSSGLATVSWHSTKIPHSKEKSVLVVSGFWPEIWMGWSRPKIPNNTKILYTFPSGLFFLFQSTQHCEVEIVSKPQKRMVSMSSQHLQNDTPFTLHQFHLGKLSVLQMRSPTGHVGWTVLMTNKYNILLLPESS